MDSLKTTRPDGNAKLAMNDLAEKNFDGMVETANADAVRRGNETTVVTGNVTVDQSRIKQKHNERCVCSLSTEEAEVRVEYARIQVRS